jgi:hypothetical protein
MSKSLDKKPSGRRYAPLVLAASFIFAGFGICRTYDPGFSVIQASASSAWSARRWRCLDTQLAL